MIRKEEVYKIGRLGKPHGVKGELSFMFDDDVFDRVDADCLVLLIDGILVPFFIEEYRFRSNETALLKLCDIDTQEQARELTGCEVYFVRSLADDADSHVSRASLSGFALVDATTGREVGTIDRVDDSTINLLFELTDGRLIPASEALIADVDVAGRRITVNLPEGILDL